MLFFFTNIVIFANTDSTQTPSKEKFQIIIDPGHGGNDIGASNHQTKESVLVLAIAKKIELIIQKNEPQYSVTLTRKNNSYLSLANRLKNESADLFLSLHANSSISSRVEGLEIYLQTEQKTKSTNDQNSTVESIVQDLESVGKTRYSLQFSKQLHKNWLHSPAVIRRSPFFVLEKTKFPSVLIEIGFLTNINEAKKLATDEYQNLIAETIVKTIADYKKSIE